MQELLILVEVAYRDQMLLSIDCNWMLVVLFGKKKKKKRLQPPRRHENLKYILITCVFEELT